MSGNENGRGRIPWAWWLLLVSVLVSPALWAATRGPSAGLAALPPLPEGIGDELDERLDGGFFRLVDAAGREITQTARILAEGDSYIDEDNRLYRVTAVVGDLVRVEEAGLVQLPDPAEIRAQFDRQPSVLASVAQFLGLAQKPNRVVGIYHTHSDESYVPTSGTETEWTGDIYQVGRVMRDALEEAGYTVYWSDNNHNPHDGQAYLRSRRTAAELLRHRPGTLIDVHRDAIPDPNAYLTRQNGDSVARVRLVVGRQNQNQEANLEYAKRLKALADDEFPGLVKGIFLARGNYNQDLGPNTILLEFGTHTVSLADAQKAAQLFAKVIPAAAGLAPGTGGSAEAGQGAAGWRWVAWLLVAAVLGTIAFLVLNKGAWERWSRRLGGAGGGSMEASEELSPPAEEREGRG